jgi:hypothetical protein
MRSGDQYWYILLGGWEDVKSVSATKVASTSSVLLQVEYENEVDSWSLNVDYRHVRFMGNSSDGSRLLRIEGAPGNPGTGAFASAAQPSSGEGEAPAEVHDGLELQWAQRAGDDSLFSDAVDALMADESWA